MKLSVAGIEDYGSWKAIGIELPSYDVKAVAELGKSAPRWAHFGIGNIFRVFIGSIADGLLEEGYLDRGITCIETFDFEVVDKIYTPHDNLSMNIILKGDGNRENKVIGAFAESVKADLSSESSYNRMKEIFTADSLQLISFTITEKGYALYRPDGSFIPYVMKDMENGPDCVTGAMGIVTSMLWQRFLAGKKPVSLVSMDNCANNGSLLRKSVITTGEEWKKRGFVTEDFITYISDEKQVAFPWTMIDKITPRPSEQIALELKEKGIEEMTTVITEKRTYIAPFVNAEKPQYLVIEDNFPNGRPALEEGYGVYMADRETVRKAERMKVTACLNPVHSALGPIGVVLGMELFPDVMEDSELLKMGHMVAYQEGLPMVEDPGIISPKAFTDELFDDRFPNRYLADTNLRLCTDVTQGVGVRFGETIKACVAKSGSAEHLLAIPMGIAGLMRYMMGIDDQGRSYELAPDPLAEDWNKRLEDIRLGEPDSLKDQLRPILSNEKIFFTDLYKAGIGGKIENLLREMIAGKGACRDTIHRYFGE